MTKPNGKENKKKLPDEMLLKLLSESVIQTAVSIMITDIKGNICYVNPAFCEKTGYKLEEIFGKNPRVLKSGLTPPKLYDELWKTILAGKSWAGEFCNKNKDGKLYWEAITISPLRDDSGVIAYFAAFWEDVTREKFDEGALKSHLKYLERESATDALTGIYNRRHILKELQKEVQRTIRYERRLAGMMIDVDGLKAINDEYGHLAGDHMIGEIANAIQENLRTCDILGRYGGDEFLVILPETPSEHAHIIAERIRKQVGSRNFSINDKRIHLTVSIGLLSFENLKDADEIVFVGKIDDALLRAKKAGKNCIVEEKR